MGDSQHLTPEEQLAFAREQFEAAQDFTVAVEEEFAVLDPETLDLSNRFEELQAAAQATALEDHLVGELIASEVEVRTGRCADFEEASARLGERRGAGQQEGAGGRGLPAAAGRRRRRGGWGRAGGGGGGRGRGGRGGGGGGGRAEGGGQGPGPRARAR